MNEDPERTLLTVDEVAEQLNMARRQVYYLMDSGVLGSVSFPTRNGRKGGARRVRQSAVDAYVALHEQPAATP